MKTLHLGMIAAFGFIIFFLSPSDSYASRCAVKETIYSAPQFFLLSDSVFAGTVTSITDYGNHQWQVHFDIEKIWKGVATRQTSTVMTGTLQACGYSIAVGEKYLIYTNGSPSFINPIDSKMYSDAQEDIALFDDPKFQSQEKVKEDLNKKLEIAQGRVGSMMMDKLYHIPISAVGVNQVNSTLDIVINDQKATLSLEQYRQSLQDILGDIPIKVEFGYATALAPILHSMNDQGQTTSNVMGKFSFTPQNQNQTGRNLGPPTIPSVIESPLKQLKSGIAANDVKCNNGLSLVIKAEDGSPACVKPDTASILLQRSGWVMFSSYSNSTELNNTNQNEQQNYLPNISQRFISMTIQGNTGTLSYLPVIVSDKIILEKPDDSIILQQLHPGWENRKSSSNSFFDVIDEKGNDIRASFFQQDTLGIESLGPSADMMVTFGNPFSMPIRNIVSIAIITYSMDEIGPTNSTYHLKFASLYPVNVNLPRGIELVSNNTKTYSEFWTKDYSGNIITSNSTYIQYGDSKVKIQNMILYDMTFK